MLQLSRVTAVQYASENIRVNTVIPGQLHTPMVEVRLAKQRATVSDEDLQLRSRNDSEASARAIARVGDVRSGLSDIAPERVGAELGDAERSADLFEKEFHVKLYFRQTPKNLGIGP